MVQKDRDERRTWARERWKLDRKHSAERLSDPTGLKSGNTQNQEGTTMFGMVKALWKDEDGLTTVEYALLLALLVVAAIGIWTAFGAKVQGSVNASTSAFDNASATK